MYAVTIVPRMDLRRVADLQASGGTLSQSDNDLIARFQEEYAVLLKRAQMAHRPERLLQLKPIVRVASSFRGANTITKTTKRRMGIAADDSSDSDTRKDDVCSDDDTHREDAIERKALRKAAKRSRPSPRDAQDAQDAQNAQNTQNRQDNAQSSDVANQTVLACVVVKSVDDSDSGGYSEHNQDSDSSDSDHGEEEYFED